MEHDFLQHYQWLARYNRWFNTRLFDACEKLGDEERKRERGAFFGSIHRTLDHLIVGDQIWLKRLHQCGVDHGFVSNSLATGVLDLAPGHALGQPVFEDWAPMRSKREQLDGVIESWLSEIPSTFPRFGMHYSNSSGVRRDHPAWQAMSHFFNHQTHHRGQVTTLLKQAGVDVGVTDMIALVAAPAVA